METLISIYLYDGHVAKYLGYRKLDIFNLTEIHMNKLKESFRKVEDIIEFNKHWIDIYIDNNDLYGGLFKLGNDLLLDTVYEEIKTRLDLINI